MRAVLLLNDSEVVEAWAHAALSEAVQDGLEITQIARCVNTPPRKVTRKNLAYYGLAFASRRGLATVATAEISDLVSDATPRVRFLSIHEGAWQRIPSDVAEGFAGADVVVKFGMTLLRGPSEIPVKHGVISYHHGDPERYRGRPAGYYELLNGERVQGVIVQRLSEILDGGGVLAKAYSPVVPHSYAQTLRNVQLAGVPLLARAIRVLESGDDLEGPTTLGPNYRLPATPNVLRQIAGLFVRKLARAAYGLSREKSWKVGHLALDIDPEAATLIPSSDLDPIPHPDGYVFAADPCADDSDGFFCELLNSRTGLGEIAHWRQGAWTLGVMASLGHASYPQVVQHGDVRYLFPEIASFSSPRLFTLTASGSAEGEGTPLKGLEGRRLIDATLLDAGGIWYLFAGEADTAAFKLDLWWSHRLLGPYRRHPSSPVCVDPRGARMAGPIVQIQGRRYRFGQDGTQKYGGSVRIHRIEELNPIAYRESVCGSIRIAEHWGPHTVNLTQDGLLVDYYSERTALGAGLRRIRARITSNR